MLSIRLFRARRGTVQYNAKSVFGFVELLSHIDPLSTSVPAAVSAKQGSQMSSARNLQPPLPLPQLNNVIVHKKCLCDLTSTRSYFHTDKDSLLHFFFQLLCILACCIVFPTECMCGCGLHSLLMERHVTGGFSNMEVEERSFNNCFLQVPTQNWYLSVKTKIYLKQLWTTLLSEQGHSPFCTVCIPCKSIILAAFCVGNQSNLRCSVIFFSFRVRMVRWWLVSKAGYETSLLLCYLWRVYRH